MTTKYFPKYDTRVGSDGFYNSQGAFDEGFYNYNGSSEHVYNAEGGNLSPIQSAQNNLSEFLDKLRIATKKLSDLRIYLIAVEKELLSAITVKTQQQSMYDNINGTWHPKRKKEAGESLANWVGIVNDLTGKKERTISNIKIAEKEISDLTTSIAGAKKDLNDAIAAAKRAVESSPAYVNQKQKDDAKAALEKIKSDADSATQRTFAEQSGKTKRYMLIGGIVVVVGLIGLFVANKLKKA